MNSKHYVIISVLAGAVVGFFISSLHNVPNVTGSVQRFPYNLYLNGASAAGANVQYSS